MNIETKLKFFICSIAFNGSDGLKLPNLNDIYDDHIIRDEEPCALFERRSRYSCEPTPFLVSACLIKRLKRHFEPGFNKSPYRHRCRKQQNHARTNHKKHDIRAHAQFSKEPQTVPVSKTITVLPGSDREKERHVTDQCNHPGVSTPSRVSVLKQLLLGHSKTSELLMSSEAAQMYSRACKSSNEQKQIEEQKRMNTTFHDCAWLKTTTPVHSLPPIESLTLDTREPPPSVHLTTPTTSSIDSASNLNVTPLAILSADKITNALVSAKELDGPMCSSLD